MAQGRKVQTSYNQIEEVDRLLIPDCSDRYRERTTEKISRGRFMTCPLNDP